MSLDQWIWAAEIVRELAAPDCPSREDSNGVDYCLLCGADLRWVRTSEYTGVVQDPRDHSETCPWRKAREWVAEFGTEGTPMPEFAHYPKTGQSATEGFYQQ